MRKILIIIRGKSKKAEKLVFHLSGLTSIKYPYIYKILNMPLDNLILKNNSSNQFTQSYLNNVKTLIEGYLHSFLIEF